MYVHVCVCVMLLLLIVELGSIRIFVFMVGWHSGCIEAARVVMAFVL